MLKALLLLSLLTGCATTANRGPASVNDAIPVSPFESSLGVAELGRGLTASGPAGLRCVLGTARTRATSPRIQYFLKHEGSYRRNVYAFGITIVVSETAIENPTMNPEWTKHTFRSELAEHCGHQFLAGEQLGVMIARELEVSDFPAGEADLELFGSIAALQARVAGIKALDEPGFHVGYVDTPGGIIAKYNGDTSHELMSLESFETLFWSHPAPETTSDLLSANVRVGILLQANP